jgi:anti-sigma regulatory factor (Ser/Thr protein kinase)
VLDLPGEPLDARRTRAWLADMASRWGLGEVDDAVLVASELVENMAQHAPGPGSVRIELRGRGLSVAVYDSEPNPPLLISPAAATAAGGRGMAVIDAVALTWGHNPRPGGGKVVWAVIPVG